MASLLAQRGTVWHHKCLMVELSLPFSADVWDSWRSIK
jgi:hypothetical protein